MKARSALLAPVLVLSACGREPSSPGRSVPPSVGVPAPLPTSAELHSPDVTVRRAAVQRLVGSPMGAQGLLADLRQALSDPDRWVREEAGKALRDLGPAAAPAVAELTQALLDEDDYVRWRAAEALGRIGAAALPAVPTLEDRAQDAQETEVVRASSATALQRIRGGPAADAPGATGR